MDSENELVEAVGEWHGRIVELQALIAALEGEVVEAEVGLVEEITAVNSFEFKLRAGLSQMIGRLDKLTAEIVDLRRKLRHHYDFGAEIDPVEGAYDNVGAAFHEPELDHKAYRFHSSMPQPPAAALGEDERDELKRLYRELARRFHPDLGVGADDRQYRTQLMMAINAAYAAGDLERLRELALEPDRLDPSTFGNDAEQMVNFLLRELARLQRRLAEIGAELASIQARKHYKLMQQAQRAEEKGNDWLAEMKAQMQEEISRKLVEREVLRQELEIQEMITAEERDGLQGEAFAEAILDISLDATFDMDPDVEAEDWLFRRKRDAYWNDDWDESES